MKVLRAKETEELTELERELLGRLYEMSCLSNGTELLRLSEWAAEKGFEWGPVEQAFRRLREMEWIEKPVMDWAARLTPLGILGTEAACAMPPELSSHNNAVREQILLGLTAGEDAGHRRSSLETLATESGLDKMEVLRNGLFLLHVGLLEAPISGYFKLTTRGIEAVKQLQLAKARGKRFQELKGGADLTPQARGHELEAVIEEIAGEDGWATERNVRGYGEEQDLILNRDREYYLLEARWLKESVQPRAIREFSNRVEARAGVRGLIASMSGFTEAAIAEAKDQLRSRVILLFGPRDIEALVEGERRFTELLNTKFHSVVARREILIE
jgi:hypothetical protein